VRAYLCFLSSHNPGHCHRALGIRDHQHRRAQSPLFSVDHDDTFTLAGPADNNAPACQRVIIKGVQRLSGLEQTKVGDIHNIVDRTQSHRQQSFLHPIRRRLHLDISDNRPNIPHAPVPVQDLDRAFLRREMNLFQLGQFEFTIQDSGNLPGQTQHVKAVRTVRCDLQLKDRVALDLVDLLDFHAGHGQSMGQFFGWNADRHIIFKPL